MKSNKKSEQPELKKDTKEDKSKYQKARTLEVNWLKNKGFYNHEKSQPQKTNVQGKIDNKNIDKFFRDFENY